MKYIFPFYGEKYEFLEKKWWHRLMKIIFFMAVFTCLLFSATIYFNFEIKTPALLQGATYDIMSGYTPQEVEKVYPELKDNMDILYSLSATMKTRPISEIPALYPELFTPEQISKLQSAQQGQPTKVPNMIHQITSDVLAGMKPTDIEKNYPEMKGQDLYIFAQLASDIADGMPTSQAPRLYPEIFPQEAIDWGKTQPIINRGDIYPKNVVQNTQQKQRGITTIVKDAPGFLERFNVAWSYFKIVIYTIITTYLLMLFFQIIYFKGIIYIMYGDNLEQLKK